MLTGILCALFAGLAWGMVFVTPLLLDDYPGLLLSLGRYVAFGMIALVPAWFGRRQLATLTRADWAVAFRLALIGNLLYYALLATAIQLADAPLPTMIIGTLPVVIAICANWRPGQTSDAVRWTKLLPSLLLLATGILLVNASELARLHTLAASRTTSDYLLGCLLAAGGVACWTWYPIVNARYLRAHPHIRSSTWATVQGLATLPLALAGFIVYTVYTQIITPALPILGPRPLHFVLGMAVIGLVASWLGVLLWNKASQLLPTTLVVQLIVFETLAALLYTFVLRGTLPTWPVAAGITLLCGGVLLGVRLFTRPRQPA